MIDLDSNTGAVLMHRLGQHKQPRHKMILVDSKLGGSIRPFRRIYTGIFYHNKSGAALGPQFIIVDMAKTHFPALLAIVGSHRCHHDTVLHCHTTDRQWFKNMFIIAFHFLSSRIIIFIY